MAADRSMTLDFPLLAHLFWLLPLCGLGFFLAARARSRELAAFASPGALARISRTRTRTQSFLSGGLRLAALGFAIFAALGPRWGSTFEEVKQEGRDLLVLLDCSRSMLAEDLAPNRLERAKADIRDLLASLPGHRVGLVGFAGRADLLCPLTTDYAFFNLALGEAGPDSVGRGGTLIGDAVRKALTLFGEAGAETRDILLITDGEDQSSFPQEAAKAAASQKVKIFAVGLGDETEGGRIPSQDPDGGRRYLVHEGREHWSKLDSSTLRGMALETGGKYLNLGTKVGDIGAFYLQAVAGEAERAFEARTHEHKIPRFQIFLAVALALLLLEFFMGLGPRSLPSGASFLVVFPLCLLLSPAQSVLASPESLVEKGRRLYKEGDYAGAAALFADAAKAKPGSPEIAFNEGTALAAGGDHSAAEESLQRALATRDKGLEEKAKYNLGYNAFVGQDYAKAAAYFRDALALDGRDEDARRNLELALRLAAVSPPPQGQKKDDKKENEKKGNENQKQEGGGQDPGKGGPSPTPSGGDTKGDPKAAPSPPSGSNPKNEKPMSPEEAERLLDQLKAQEKDRRRERLRGQAAASTVEKDW